jgi:hypothetical protein
MQQYDISFIYTFSFLTHIINIFNYNIKINNALYLSNIISLFGFIIMVYNYPYFFYNKYNYLLNTDLFTFNLTNILIHVIPLYIYKNKNKINKNNIDITIFYTSIILLIYYLLFNSILIKIYPFDNINLILLVIILLFFIRFVIIYVNT